MNIISVVRDQSKNSVFFSLCLFSELRLYSCFGLQWDKFTSSMDKLSA